MVIIFAKLQHDTANGNENYIMILSRPIKSCEMCKLYYSSTSCAAASFIAAFTAGVQFDCEQVDLITHLTASGVDFHTINPKGNVPCMEFVCGVKLNESLATLNFIADQAGPGLLAPEKGTLKWYALQNILSHIATQLHPNLGQLYDLVEQNSSLEAVKVYLTSEVKNELKFLEHQIITTTTPDQQFLMGDSFTIADSYLYIVLSWLKFVNISLRDYPRVDAYFRGVRSMECVAEAELRMAAQPTTVLGEEDIVRWK
jgi:glutathione S-transferase